MFLNDITDTITDHINNQPKLPFYKLKNYIILNYILFLYMYLYMYNNHIFSLEINYIISLDILLGLLYHDLIRIKKYYPFNNILLGLSALFAFWIGYNKIELNLYSLFLLLYFILASHYKDIKDIKGDKVEKINTLPILIGKHNFFIIMSIIIFIYSLIFFYFNKASLIFIFIYYFIFIFLFNIEKFDLKKELYLKILVLLAIILLFNIIFKY